MRPIPELAALAHEYYAALSEPVAHVELRTVIPEALAVEIVFDFMKRVHAGESDPDPTPTSGDIAAAIEAKRARRQAQLDT